MCKSATVPPLGPDILVPEAPHEDRNLLFHDGDDPNSQPARDDAGEIVGNTVHEMPDSPRTAKAKRDAIWEGRMKNMFADMGGACSHRGSCVHKGKKSRRRTPTRQIMLNCPSSSSYILIKHNFAWAGT